MTIVSDSTQEMVTEIYLPVDLLDISEEFIRIFALDAHTIGLSNSPPQLWVNQRLWESRATIMIDNHEITILLPPEVVRFYRPKKIEIAGTIDQDQLLLVITQ